MVPTCITLDSRFHGNYYFQYKAHSWQDIPEHTTITTLTKVRERYTLAPTDLYIADNQYFVVCKEENSIT